MIDAWELWNEPDIGFFAGRAEEYVGLLKAGFLGIMMFGFFVAGYVSGRFALVEPQLSGGMAALILFFLITVVTISGAGLNLIGIAVFGIGAAIFGPMGGTIGYQRNNS